MNFSLFLLYGYVFNLTVWAAVHFPTVSRPSTTFHTEATCIVDQWPIIMRSISLFAFFHIRGSSFNIYKVSASMMNWFSPKSMSGRQKMWIKGWNDWLNSHLALSILSSFCRHYHLSIDPLGHLRHCLLFLSEVQVEQWVKSSPCSQPTLLHSNKLIWAGH